MAVIGNVAASRYHELVASSLHQVEVHSSAQSVLGAAGQEAFGAIDARDCDEAVDILATTPYTGPLPVSTHETFVRLAGLLDDAKLIPPAADRPPRRSAQPRTTKTAAAATSS